MKTLSSALKEISGQSKPALMTHVVLGYPGLAESLELVLAMAESGAQLIELQIPFSDPVADGPTIMRANEHALAQSVTPRACIEAVASISAKCPVPLLIMSYFNPVFGYAYNEKSSGLQRFCKDAAAAGVQGLIIPDVPPEEQREGFWHIPQEHGLVSIPLVSPVSSDERMRKVKAVAAEGFVYCVSTTGTTGARTELPAETASYLARVKSIFNIPRAVGFGISSPEQVRSLTGHAEIAIVGSAMLDLIGKTPAAERIAAVKKFTRELAGS